MKYIKLLGLISLVSITFFYTDKLIDVSIEEDDIMISINEVSGSYYKEAINASIDGDYIIPGKKGIEVDKDKSYSEMKKLGYYDKSLLVYSDIYPGISIVNNYNKYIVSGNTYYNNVSLIYIVKSSNGLDNLLNSIKDTNIKINLFIDSNYLNNNINSISKISNHEIYNYGLNGKYTKDNLIIGNNIINNKANNNANICLFLIKNENSLKNCIDNKSYSIMPSIDGDYNNIKNSLMNGSIILIDNTYDILNIINYINSKGYNIVPLSKLIIE